MSFKTVDQLDGPPVVGQTYLVPSIQTSDYGWVPIILHLHTDEELGLPKLHVHYDYRFCNPHEVHSSKNSFDIQVLEVRKNTEYKYLPFVCVNSRNYPDACDFISQGLSHIAELHELCKNRKMVQNICPHKGYSLKSVQPDENGIITCPLHGARWAKDGSYVPVSAINHRLAQQYLESGLPTRKPTTLRLFSNNLKLNNQINLKDIVECENYQPYVLQKFQIINGSIYFFEKRVSVQIYEPIEVVGWFLTTQDYSHPIALNFFFEKCSRKTYHLEKGMFHINLS